MATTDLEAPIDLDKLSNLPNTNYDPAVYRCVYLKDEKMTGKVSVFKSGKLIVAGVKDESKAYETIHRALEILKGMGIQLKENPEIRIQNIVAVVDLGSPIDLEKLSQENMGAIYEPEQFSGVILKEDGHEFTCLVFRTGKVILAGVKSESELKPAAKRIEEYLLPYLNN